MSNEELAKRIKAGEREYIALLWEQVVKFISMQARKRARQLEGYGGVTAEDLCQSGFFALVDAVKTFDPTSGGSFISWLDFYLKSEFASTVGYRTSRRDMLNFASGLDEPIPGMDDFTAADYVADPTAEEDFEGVENAVWNRQLRDALETTLDTLPEKWAAAIRGKYFHNKKAAEIGKHLGISPSRVTELQRNGLNRLRRNSTETRLQDFVEERTAYYSGVGLGAFGHSGSQPERLVIWREETANRVRNRL